MVFESLVLRLVFTKFLCWIEMLGFVPLLLELEDHSGPVTAIVQVLKDKFLLEWSNGNDL